MDLVQEMLKYSEQLYKKAFALSGDENDANDLVQETYLSTLISINKGLVITNVKPYLLKVLKNKYIDIYRKRHLQPDLNLLSVETEEDEPLVFNTGFNRAEVLNSIRRELAYLPKIYREVMVQYYLEKKSVNEIASNLKISSSSVMNRLDRGRDKVKEGVIKMEPIAVNSFHPDNIILYISGKLGLNKEPLTVITNMIEQNALILAYEKPITIKAISEMLGISMVFAEEAVEKLVANELMKGVGSKVYTNFPIIDEEFMLNIQDIQNKYVNSTFDKANVVFKGLIKEYKKMNLFAKYDEVQLYLYSLYSIFYLCTRHFFETLKLLDYPDYPDRPNSGKWLIDFGYKRNRIDKDVLKIPHRLEAKFHTNNSYEVFIEIRDTYLGVSPWHTINGINNQDVGELLYHINKEMKYDHLKTFLLPHLEYLGYIYKCEDGRFKSNIPVIKQVDFDKIKQLNDEYAKKYLELFKDDMLEMILSNTIKYPKHMNIVSYKTQLITMHGIVMTYAEKAAETKIIEMKDITNYPVAIIVEKSRVYSV